jgi:hypothetical protein
MDLPIRVKNPEKLPFIGQFADVIDISQAKLPLRMQVSKRSIRLE